VGTNKLHPILITKDRLTDSHCSYSWKARFIGRIIAEKMNRDDDGRYRAFPGIPLLARLSALSQATVKRALNELCGDTGLPPLFSRRTGETFTRGGRTFQTPSYVFTLVNSDNAEGNT
jgi:hypothetical protein